MKLFKFKKPKNEEQEEQQISENSEEVVENLNDNKDPDILERENEVSLEDTASIGLPRLEDLQLDEADLTALNEDLKTEERVVEVENPKTPPENITEEAPISLEEDSSLLDVNPEDTSFFSLEEFDLEDLTGQEENEVLEEIELSEDSTEETEQDSLEIETPEESNSFTEKAFDVEEPETGEIDSSEEAKETEESEIEGAKTTGEIETEESLEEPEESEEVEEPRENTEETQNEPEEVELFLEDFVETPLYGEEAHDLPFEDEFSFNNFPVEEEALSFEEVSLDTPIEESSKALSFEEIPVDREEVSTLDLETEDNKTLEEQAVEDTKEVLKEEPETLEENETLEPEEIILSDTSEVGTNNEELLKLLGGIKEPLEDTAELEIGEISGIQETKVLEDVTSLVELSQTPEHILEYLNSQRELTEQEELEESKVIYLGTQELPHLEEEPEKKVHKSHVRKELLLNVEKKEEKPSSTSVIPILEQEQETNEKIDFITGTQTKVEEEKKSRKLLRRRKRANKAQKESETESLTQNLKGVGTKESLIFATVDENILQGGITLFNNLVKQMQSSGSLRVESMMSVLGSLGGYSTQASVREKMVNRLGIDEDQVFSVIETIDGQKYYFSDSIDKYMQTDKNSIWYMAASATMRLTGKVESNIEEIQRYSSRNLGTEKFGVPRIPKNLRSSYLPEYYVEHMWNALKPGLERFSKDPLDWPVIFGVALQRALICTRSILDPNISLKIILESAVPMSIADVDLLKPGQQDIKEKRQMQIKTLRMEIETLKMTLESNIPVEQRMLIIQQLTNKTEELYQLINQEADENS